jgi:hypothetical protein
MTDLKISEAIRREVFRQAGQKGGAARAKVLSRARRIQIAKAGARARWGKKSA